jgi:hypothetical protein
VITAWSPTPAVRARAAAGPWPVVWLALLLFTLVFTHGLSVDSTQGHTTAGVAASAQIADAHHDASLPSLSSVATEDHGGEHDSHHAGEECVSAKPQQGLALDSPCLAPLSLDAMCVRGAGKTDGPESGPEVARLSASRCSVVQQV